MPRGTIDGRRHTMRRAHDALDREVVTYAGGIDHAHLLDRSLFEPAAPIC
ncbi:MAG: hypothetical protein HY332_09800 [Chloroflexi bacterium]|nr:hypothetical protein [Chloroflexota bacterium]